MKNQTILFLAGAGMLFACKPTPYEISREITIEAPAAVVFEQVNNHKNRDAWSPWEAMDPNMTKSYEGPESGVGARYSWVGNDSVGTGSLEILESEPHSRIKSKLVFTAPWESESTIEWKFVESGNQTTVTWMIKGELPGYLFWMNEEDMDEQMAPDFEKGLAKLKSVSEGLTVPKYEMAMTEVAASPYFFIRDQVPFDDVNPAFFDERYGKIAAHLGADMASVTAPPFAIYHEWNEETKMADISVAMASSSKKPGNENIKKGDTYAGKVAMVSYMGPFEGTGDVHYFMHDKIIEAGYEMVGSPWEVYVTDPETEPDTSKWITQVYYPVRFKDEI